MPPEVNDGPKPPAQSAAGIEARVLAELQPAPAAAKSSPARPDEHANGRYAAEHPFGPTGGFPDAAPGSPEAKYMQFLTAVRDGTATRELYQTLAGDQDELIRRTVAANSSTPPDILAQLSSDSADQVKATVAENPSTPAQTLDELATQTPEIRRQVAFNRAASPELLDRLSKDPDAKVRQAVAINESTDATIVQRLAADPDSDVRLGVLGNKHLSDQTLAVLAKDPDLQLRNRAMEVQAGRPSTPGEVLDQLSQDPTHFFNRARVAQNPSAPPAVLDRLADDKLLQASVVENSSTSRETLQRLASSEHSDSEYVRVVAAQRLAEASASGEAGSPIQSRNSGAGRAEGLLGKTSPADVEEAKSADLTRGAGTALGLALITSQAIRYFDQFRKTEPTGYALPELAVPEVATQK